MVTLNDIKIVSITVDADDFPVSFNVEIILHPMLLMIKCVSLNGVLSVTVVIVDHKCNSCAV